MKHFAFISLILLVGCQSTQNGEVTRFDSNCGDISANARFELNSSNLPTSQKAPRYPINAARKGTEGYVKFEYNISKEGVPIDIHVIESYPSDTFVRAAKESLSSWKFNPVVENNEVVISKCHSVQLDFKMG